MHSPPQKYVFGHVGMYVCVCVCVRVCVQKLAFWALSLVNNMMLVPQASRAS